MDYDARTHRVIIYPQESILQTQLIKVFDTWLEEASKKMRKAYHKTFDRWKAWQWNLSGPYQSSHLYSHLVLRESAARYPKIVFETIHLNRDEVASDIAANYTYEKAARWLEGTNGSVQLVIIAVITQDPLIPWSSPALSPLNSPASSTTATATSTSSSKYYDWGISVNQLTNNSIASNTIKINTQDQNSSSKIDVDIYFATPSYPTRRGFAEHAWHASFRPNGQLLHVDDECFASDFSLSRVFPEVGEENELRVPVDSLRTFLPRAVIDDRFAQAEFLVRTAREEVRKFKPQGSTRG
jgi:hypothetical protein